MPSVSKSQHRLMSLVATNPAAAKRLGIPQRVGADFMHADKGKVKSLPVHHKKKKKHKKPRPFGSLSPESAGHYMGTPTPVGADEEGG